MRRRRLWPYVLLAPLVMLVLGTAWGLGYQLAEMLRLWVVGLARR